MNTNSALYDSTCVACRLMEAPCIFHGQLPAQEPMRDQYHAGHMSSCPLSYPEIRSNLLPGPCSCAPVTETPQ